MSLKSREQVAAEDKLLKARFSDAVRLCGPDSPRFLPFLDERQRALLAPIAAPLPDVTVLFWGGFPQSERQMPGVFCPGLGEEPEALYARFPIAAVRLEYDVRNGSLCHRDYLGAILALGMGRESVGDIVTDAAGAWVYCDETAAGRMQRELETVGKCAVRVAWDGKKCYNNPNAPGDPASSDTDGETLRVTVASLRADAVIAAVLHLSRQKAVELIQQGFVQADHLPVDEKSREFAADTVFSVRGYGKYRLVEAVRAGRKQRMHLTVEIYR